MGVITKKNEAIKPVFLLNSLVPIRYVRKMFPIVKKYINISEKKTTFKPIFQINPTNKGSNIGLAGSHKPISPREYMNLPIPI